MSYKTEFQSNNNDLQGLINIAKSLPVAENLQPEISTQDDLIAQIATALEGKVGVSGGSGSNIETCTVNVMDNGMYIEKLCATVYDGSSIKCEQYHMITSSHTFENVVKGSLVLVCSGDDTVESCFGATHLENMLILAPTSTFVFEINDDLVNIELSNSMDNSWPETDL